MQTQPKSGVRTMPDFKEILDNLPEKPPRSRLEPYRELILEMRRRGRPLREIAKVLAEKCGVSVVPSTIHDFVKTVLLRPPTDQLKTIGRDRTTKPVQTRGDRPRDASADSPSVESPRSKSREFLQRLCQRDLSLYQVSPSGCRRRLKSSYKGG